MADLAYALAATKDSSVVLSGAIHMVCVRVLSTYTSQPSFLIGSKVGTAAFLYLLASAQELNFLPFGAVNVRQEFSSTSLVHPHLKVFFARGLPVFVVVATQDEAAPCTSADSVVAEEAAQDEAAPSISYDSRRLHRTRLPLHHHFHRMAHRAACHILCKNLPSHCDFAHNSNRILAVLTFLV